jgi:putative spermidine/putrescine transport system permease protein
MDLQMRSPLSKLVILSGWIIIGFLIAPMLITIPVSLTPTRYLSMPQGEISFSHYASLANDPAWRSAIADSMIVAIGATFLSVGFGTSAAIGIWQLGLRATRLLSVFPLLPLIVPPIVSALALSRAAVAFGILDTYLAVIVSHAILGLPFVFLTVSATLEGLDRRLVQAARSLGASQIRALGSIVVPNIKSGILTGALFAFFTSWDEVVVTIFVSSRTVFTLPRKIFSDIRDDIDPSVAAISALMILVTFIIALIYLINGWRQQRSAVSK